MVFHPKIAISQNKDERLCKEHGLEGVSSLILDYEAVRMNSDGLHLSRLSKGHMESLNRIAKSLKKNELISRWASGVLQKNESCKNRRIRSGRLVLAIKTIPALIPLL